MSTTAPSDEPQTEKANDDRSFTGLVKTGSSTFALEGIALPASAYVIHAIKLALFVLGWMYFCSRSPSLGGPSTIATWWSHDIAFQKAFLWGCLVEVLGFGCMSGPLGYRVWPMFTAFLHFLRPGTIKLPLFPKLPLLGGNTRTLLDVALYAAFVASLIAALAAETIGPMQLVPVVVLLPLCGLVDKTILFAARFEHHFAMIVCFLLARDFIAPCKAVQLAVWFWAGVSKLTHAFGFVVPLMTSNNPLLQGATSRRRLFVSYPDDLRPSLFGKAMAHAGTFLEFAAPLTLLFVHEPGPLLVVGMTFVVLLHGFILSNMPAGAVFEWNVLSVYAGFFLFVGHPEVSVLDVAPGPLLVYLLIGLVLVPILGNFRPDRVSFLLAMRYYAGNWAWSAWMFRGDGIAKLHRLKRAAPLLREQLEKYAPDQVGSIASSGLAFRALHLQGRALGLLMPKAVGDRFEDYDYFDGEIIAASVLGWNFGEGHLCDEQLLSAIQEQCEYEAGELRVIMVESQPLFGTGLAWRVVDAKTGLITEGDVSLDELARRAPWDYGPADASTVAAS